jgi:16S rRNA (cytosine1402-N4)-methyltransferase
MSLNSNFHFSVLQEEAMELLNIRNKYNYIDCTFGLGGHSKLVLSNKNFTGKLYAFDLDQNAINQAKNNFPNVKIFNNNFSEIYDVVNDNNISNIGGILYDLGVSSVQLDIPERGFSYRFDSKLDMRMNQEQQIDAEYIINNYTYEQLRTIFYKYSESKYSNSVAKNIIKNRPVSTTFQLVEIIKNSMPFKETKKKKHPAKVFFQAIRIEVNNEFESLIKSLRSSIDLIAPTGRIVVITFHSLEEKIVKNIFKEYSSSKIPKEVPVIKDDTIKYKVINTKHYQLSEKELEINNRSHSAKI